MDDPVAVKEVDAVDDLPGHILDGLQGQTGRRTLLYVRCQILVDMLENEVQRHLALQTLAVSNVQKSGMKRNKESDQRCVVGKPRFLGNKWRPRGYRDDLVN